MRCLALKSNTGGVRAYSAQNGHLLLEGHPLLLRHGDRRTLAPMGVDRPDLVSADHHRDHLLDGEPLIPSVLGQPAFCSVARCWHAVRVMSELIITSPANARLKSLVALRRRRAREDAGLTLIEGYDELSLALDAGVVPRTVYHCPELMLDAAAQQDILDRVQTLGSDTQQLGRVAFEKVAYREGPDGFLAVVDSVVRSCADLAVGLAPLALICQGVEKPGNLG